VIIELSPEALEFGGLVRRALESAGGDELVQRAEESPELRQSMLEGVLAELGLWDLDPRTSTEEAEAAAAACRSAGYWAAPYPVAERLSRPSAIEADGLVVVSDTVPAAAIGGIDLRWAAVTMDGRLAAVTSTTPTGPPRPSAFVCRLQLEPLDADGAREVALGVVLPCWTLLGMLDRALELTRTHVLGREQFGQALASFQAVQFQLTDAEVERTGVEELAKYALWSIEAGNEEALDDALALRLAAVEAAEVVFRITHQLHGAIGFCDETTLSWISRYSAPLRRLPFGLSGTLDELRRRVDRRGLSGIFAGTDPA
jgi:3-oxo-4-pregnene-20-carboxyl-CoA dehydrogenase alpha subunit